MTTHTAITLTPESNFMAEVDSIKLFGSIASALLELDRDKFEKFYESVKKWETRISSAFPLIKDTLFFPIPPLSIKYNEDFSEKSEDISVFMKIKNIKKARFVSLSILEKMLDTRLEIDDILEKIEDEEWELKKEYLYTKKENDIEKRDFIVKKYEIPKNVLNRYTYFSTIFYSQAYFYNCDIFFLVKTKNSILKLIETALKLLEDRGISQDFSIGFGKFKFKGMENIELNESGNRAVLLSKFHPNENETELIVSCDKSYRIKEIRGFTKNGFHIPPYEFFTEGSYFKIAKINGKIIDIPDTKTSLNGIAYYVKSR